MAAPNYQLTMRSGPTPGKTYQLDQEETIVGRDLANDIAISDPEVSRRHARFMRKEEEFLVEDLGSTNGTFLNGERISSPQELKVGDVITLGENVVLVFEKSSYDPDATMVSQQPVQPEEAAYRQQAPMPQSYQPPSDSAAYKQPEPLPQQPVPVEEEEGGFPTWLIILIVAIVVIVCVIAVTLYFMPASWWCALTFDMLEGCPIQ